MATGYFKVIHLKVKVIGTNIKMLKFSVSCCNFSMLEPRVFRLVMIVGHQPQMTNSHLKVIHWKVKVTVTLNVKLLKFWFNASGLTGSLQTCHQGLTSASIWPLVISRPSSWSRLLSPYCKSMAVLISCYNFNVLGHRVFKLVLNIVH